MKALSATVAHIVAMFVRYFIYVGFPLYAFNILKTFDSSVQLFDLLLLLILAAIGCFFIARSMGRWAAAFEERDALWRRRGSE
jgi:hypothetical protein